VCRYFPMDVDVICWSSNTRDTIDAALSYTRRASEQSPLFRNTTGELTSTHCHHAFSLSRRAAKRFASCLAQRLLLLLNVANGATTTTITTSAATMSTADSSKPSPTTMTMDYLLRSALLDVTTDKDDDNKV